MRVRRACVPVVVVMLCLWALAGCQEATPKMPKASASPSGEVSPQPSDPPQRESAADFVRRWQAAGDLMQVSGETAEYAAMGPDCEACQGFVKSVEEVYAKGGHAEFQGSTITKLVRVGQDPPTFALTKKVPLTVIRHAGGRVQELPPGTTTLLVFLNRQNGKWTVTYFAVRR